MTQTADLLALAVTALQGADTLAGARVYSARTWSTNTGQYPLIYCKAPSEEKESLSRNGPPQFNVVATLKICGRVQVGALPDGQSAALLEQQMGALGQQIHVALINNPSIQKLIQRTSFVHTDQAITQEGSKETGEVEVSMGLEFYQGPEDFYDLPVYDLDTLGLTVDLVNRFDPAGTYADPPFPDAVNAAPRTSGPDGRAEGGLTITLNTES